MTSVVAFASVGAAAVPPLLLSSGLVNTFARREEERGSYDGEQAKSIDDDI